MTDPGKPRLPAIVDCDPGHDDAMAILLAASVLDLKGITTVHGNTDLASVTRNAGQIAALADLGDVPVAAGCERPLVRTLSYAPGVHGRSGLDGTRMPAPRAAPLDLHAADLIHREASSTEGLHLVATGPLTNVACALRRYPELTSSIAGISLMGGSLTYGNATPAAEFNVWADPEAAHEVFTSDIPIKMVGLNVTRQVPATPAHREQIRALGTRTAIAVADLLDFFSEQLRERYGLSGGSMHDPLAVAALVDPDIVRFEPMNVAIELRGEHTYGMTICDYRHLDPFDVGAPPRRGHVGLAPNAEVAVGVQPERFWDLFLSTLSTYP